MRLQEHHFLPCMRCGGSGQQPARHSQQPISEGGAKKILLQDVGPSVESHDATLYRAVVVLITKHMKRLRFREL